MSSSGVSRSSLHYMTVFTLALCLGLSERRDSARRPPCFSPMPRVNERPLARRRLHSSKPRTPHSRSTNSRLYPAVEQRFLTQDENSVSLRLVMALCAREGGVEHLGGALLTSRFFRSQALRYRMLQPQWKGFSDRSTTRSIRNESKNPGGTVSKRLCCR